MATRKSPSHQLSRSEGLAHIENYYRSGVRASDYYRQHGLSAQQFYTWRRCYLAEHSDPTRPTKPAKSVLHPVQVEPFGGLRFSGLEIHYPHGVRVVIGTDLPMDIEKLSALIQLHV